jgi:membrane-associated protease RseP (regulator of RpoE activity)
MIFLHIILFLLTIGSTIFVGSQLFGFAGGFLYSFAIMTILFAHEMGHYLMTRKYGIPSTLPFFIPFPMEPFGTFGAIIRMKGVIINKRTLFDIGVAGPLCGFVVALPFIITGLLLSKVQVIIGGLNFDQLGKPLLLIILQNVLIGEIPSGLGLVPHPFIYAGWVGLFVTALNLLPVGQLDGGHVVYAVFGDKSRLVSRLSITILALLAIFYNPGWLTLVILLLIFGRRHPQPYDTETRLDNKRKFIAGIVLVIFVLSFIPAPFPELNTANILDMIRKGGIFK